jgi:hypothetical protein
LAAHAGAQHLRRQARIDTTLDQLLPHAFGPQNLADAASES